MNEGENGLIANINEASSSSNAAPRKPPLHRNQVGPPSFPLSWDRLIFFEIQGLCKLQAQEAEMRWLVHKEEERYHLTRTD